MFQLLVLLSAADIALAALRTEEAVKETVSCSAYALRDLEGNEIRFTVSTLRSKQFDAFIPSISPILENDWYSINDCNNDALIRGFDLLCNTFARYFLNELESDIMKIDTVEIHDRQVYMLLNQFADIVIKKITDEHLHIVNY